MTKNQLTYLLVLVTLAVLWTFFNTLFIAAMNQVHKGGCFRLF